MVPEYVTFTPEFEPWFIPENNKVWLAGHYGMYGQLDAVDRRAVDRKQAYALFVAGTLFDTQRRSNGDSGRLSGVWMLGSHDNHIAHRRHTARKVHYAGGGDTVIVGDEN